MASFFTSARRSWLFGLSSFALTLLTWLWLAVCFTAREQAWWNSIVWFFAGFAAAIVLALRGIRSVVGIVALLLALPSFALLFIMHFG
jgi:hypothetical protein